MQSRDVMFKVGEPGPDRHPSGQVLVLIGGSMAMEATSKLGCGIVPGLWRRLPTMPESNGRTTSVDPTPESLAEFC